MQCNPMKGATGPFFPPRPLLRPHQPRWRPARLRVRTRLPLGQRGGRLTSTHPASMVVAVVVGGGDGGGSCGAPAPRAGWSASCCRGAATPAPSWGRRCRPITQPVGARAPPPRGGGWWHPRRPGGGRLCRAARWAYLSGRAPTAAAAQLPPPLLPPSFPRHPHTMSAAWGDWDGPCAAGWPAGAHVVLGGGRGALGGTAGAAGLPLTRGGGPSRRRRRHRHRHRHRLRHHHHRRHAHHHRSPPAELGAMSAVTGGSGSTLPRRPPPSRARPGQPAAARRDGRRPPQRQRVAPAAVSAGRRRGATT